MDENIYAYDRETLACLAGFENLWQRITVGSSAAPRFTEEEALRRFIRDEHSAAGYYAALAHCFSQPGRTLLTAHCADARRRARRLQAEYFIRTGQRCTENDTISTEAGKLEALRRALQSEQARSKAYANAAENTTCPVLRELYNSFSVETANRASALRALLLRCF